jgi:hypothetical protein
MSADQDRSDHTLECSVSQNRSSVQNASGFRSMNISIVCCPALERRPNLNPNGESTFNMGFRAVRKKKC